MEQLNFMAILIAVVANFALGFLWYTPLFGKVWGREMGYDPNQKPPASELMKGMAFMVIGNFLMAWVFAHDMVAWSYVPEMAAANPVHSAIMAAFFTWLGFYFPGDLGSTAWERKSWTLFFINTGYHLASLLVVSFILTMMPA